MKLFNLADDPGEKKDHAAAERGMVKALEDELAVWESDVLAGVELRA